MIEKQYLIPSNLDLIKLITEKEQSKQLYKANPRENHLPKFLPRYLYFINTYYMLRNKDKSNTKNTFINISQTQLKQVFGKTVNIGVCIKNLLAWGIFERNDNFHPGIFSKSYRLTEQYREVKAKVFQCDDAELMQSIEKGFEKLAVKNEKRKENKTKNILENSKLKEYRFLRDNLLEIEIDSIEARKYVSWCLENKIPLRDKDVKTKWFTYTKKNRTFDDENYTAFLSSINQISEGDINFKLDSNSGRVYSYITNLPNLLLPFISVKKYTNDIGKSLEESKLIEIDITSSQPYFLIKFLHDYITKKHINDNNGKSLEENKYNYYTHISPNDFPTIEELKKLTHIYSTDLYSHISTEIGITREEAKHLFFSKYLFSKPTTQSSVRTYMSTHFPLITQIIDSFKTRGLEYLPNQLSKLESECIINRICKRISIQYSDSIILTKHDCIITTLDMLDVVYNIMLEELQEFTGIPVKLKTKVFERPQFEYSGSEIENNTYKYDVLVQDFVNETKVTDKISNDEDNGNIIIETLNEKYFKGYFYREFFVKCDSDETEEYQKKRIDYEIYKVHYQHFGRKELVLTEEDEQEYNNLSYKF
jgi:hypothetical protein